MAATSHHLYAHVPFCRLVCAYCDFVTVGGRGSDIPRYADALVAELELRPAPGELRTIYFGGGTPSLLSGEQVARVIDTARARWRRSVLDEVTLEANPSARESPDWQGLRTAGVDRVSLGLQSLRDADLRALTRGHTAAEGRRAYTDARGAGFENVSVDLIYGIPDQSAADWEESLVAAIELRPDHVSCYALQLALQPDEWAAPPRAGALRWRKRTAPRLDDASAVEQYRRAERQLAAAGYRHYELSSWALPGRESRHNAAYWARRPYTGIGAGAHSFDGADERSWNDRDLDRYLSGVEAGRRPIAGRDVLDEPARAFEAVALGLRRVEGFSRREYAAEFGTDPIVRFAGAAETTMEQGLIEFHGDFIRLSEAGRVLASEALVEFAPVPPAR